MSGKGQRASGAFEPGAPVSDGRSAVRLLGDGERHEAWLGWDDHLVAPDVLRLLRPDQADDERARRAVALEGRILRGLAHPGTCAAPVPFDPRVPHVIRDCADASGSRRPRGMG